MLREPIGGGIELALATPQLAEEIYALIDANRQWLGRWLPFVGITKTTADTRRFLKEQLCLLAEEKALTLAIFLNGRPVGMVGLNRVDAQNRVGYIGYWIDERAAGQGVMTRAAGRLVELAFEQFPLDRLEIHCAAGNAASCAVAGKLGFVREAVLRRAIRSHNHVDDRVIWGLLREEWRG